MSDGRVSEMGSFNQLMCHAGPFAELLTNYYLSQQNQEFPTGKAQDRSNVANIAGGAQKICRETLYPLNEFINTNLTCMLKLPYINLAVSPSSIHWFKNSNMFKGLFW